MTKATELRGHAAKCRLLADLTISPDGKQALEKAAAEFDAQADQADDTHANGVDDLAGDPPPTH